MIVARGLGRDTDVLGAIVAGGLGIQALAQTEQPRYGGGGRRRRDDEHETVRRQWELLEAKLRAQAERQRAAETGKASTTPEEPRKVRARPAPIEAAVNRVLERARKRAREEAARLAEEAEELETLMLMAAVADED